MKIGGCISNNVKNFTIEQFSTLQFQLTFERNPGLYWSASLHSGSGQEILHPLLLRWKTKTNWDLVTNNLGSLLVLLWKPLCDIHRHPGLNEIFLSNYTFCANLALCTSLAIYHFISNFFWLAMVLILRHFIIRYTISYLINTCMIRIIVIIIMIKLFLSR